MEYGIYIDVLFLSDFCMDLMALLLTGVFLRKPHSIRKTVLASFLGSVVSIILFLVLPNYLLYVTMVHFAVNPLMVWLCFRPVTWKDFLSEWAGCYILILLSGGAMQWVYVTVFHERNMGVCILLTFLFGMGVAFIWEKQNVIGKSTYRVKLKVGSDVIELKAYYDTGNLLMDPYFKKPVHIVQKSGILQILKKYQIPARLITFSSLGESNGIIETYTIDELQVYKKDEIIEVSPAVVGLAKDQLFEHADYQMILNSHLHLQK